MVDEKWSPRVRALATEDSDVLVWVLSDVEITSALWRRLRAGDLDERSRAAAQRSVDALLAAFSVVVDVALVARRARRVLALHPLRAADSLQLAAALVACDDRPTLLPFITLDDRLREAAGNEGFNVFP